MIRTEFFKRYTRLVLAVLMCLLVFSVCSIAASSNSLFRKKVVVNRTTTTYNDVSTIILSAAVVNTANEVNDVFVYFDSRLPVNVGGSDAIDLRKYSSILSKLLPLETVNTTVFLVITHSLQQIS